MKIAFDAKRAYQNTTGLGHYSRTLISSLATYFPEHYYFLCAPKLSNKLDVAEFSNVENVTPTNIFSKTFKSLWRSNGVKKDLLKKEVDLYHGLSHEIPTGINRTRIKSVVTIHDLIFERYPEQYAKIDVQIYRQKIKYACRHADQIISISKQTKNDLINFYKVKPEKINICYQSCNPAFSIKASDLEKDRVRKLYQLPDRFFLYVGSVIERKNLLNICKAMNLLKNRFHCKLIVIGEGSSYKNVVKQYIAQNCLEEQIIFLSESPAAKSASGFQLGTDFPAIYQLAEGLVYPSVFEGFGIPVLEALWSQTPVITSNSSCLPETGGDAAIYVDPYSAEQIASAMLTLETDKQLVQQMKRKGLVHAKNFTPEKCAAKVMDLYLRLV